MTLLIKKVLKHCFNSLIFALFFTMFCLQNLWANNSINNFKSSINNYNSKLEIFDNQKKVGEFFVALAKNNLQKQRGLMNVKKLEAQFGMLFYFDREEIIYMWMKNTFISLDMIFIDRNNIIVDIKPHATPLSLDVISSQKKSNKVLEINAGLSKKMKIKIGQKILIHEH